MAAHEMDRYLDDPEAFAGLTDEAKAAAFLGQAQGDTVATEAAAPAVATETGETPAAESALTPEATPETEPDPVVLAKDGKHTIPYQELEQARERAAHWEQVARDAQAAAEALKQPTTPAEPAAAAIDIDALEDQCFEAGLEGDKDLVKSLRAQINAEIQRRAEVAASERIARQKADEAQQQAIVEAQRLFESQVAKAKQDFPFLDENSPQANAQAISDVIEWRDYRVSQGDSAADALAKAVAKFAPIYAPTQTTAPSTPTAAHKAAQAIAKAKTAVPTSLSEIPAGTSAHHDEAAAMLDMGSMDLMTKFQGKSPDQIMELMSRVI